MFLLISIGGFTQQTILTAWTFPTGNAADTLPDQASPLNTNKYIRTRGGTSMISFKNGSTTKAAQASGWENGKDVKFWEVEINTNGFHLLHISSKQTAGGTEPGPKDYRIQYRIGPDGIWTDIAGGEITVGNDWTTGVVANLQIPAECDNQDVLFFRWIMTSNFDINGAELIPGGKAKIDDITITGEPTSGIENYAENRISVSAYPNPCTDHLNIRSEQEFKAVEIFNLTGSKVYDLQTGTCNLTVNTSRFPAGEYVLVLHITGSMQPQQKLLIIH